ncbi:hypothetical protein AB0C51_17975 [Streptomyces pathocidini]|uniref:Competence protein ComEC n=1 Tax=Streptomyces pathocidini TaxID=1650571 RepID=A0ABW7UTG2_9ACTN|nr:hypothetical protein [Streptomyces pathocidini]
MHETQLAPVVAFLFAVAVVGFEQIVQWRFGAMGIVGISLLATGVKARNVTCACIGALVLALLVM